MLEVSRNIFREIVKIRITCIFKIKMHCQNYLSIVQNKYLSTEDHIYALVRTDLPDTEDSFLIGKVLRTIYGSYVFNKSTQYLYENV